MIIILGCQQLLSKVDVMRVPMKRPLDLFILFVFMPGTGIDWRDLVEPLILGAVGVSTLTKPLWDDPAGCQGVST